LRDALSELCSLRCGRRRKPAIILTLSLSKGEDNPPMQIFVYMLRCRDRSYYVGLTRTGLDKRIGEHKEGRFKGYTRSRRPVELVWSQEFQWLKDAIECERRLKAWRREKKEALIKGDYDALRALSRTARTPHPSTSSG